MGWSSGRSLAIFGLAALCGLANAQAAYGGIQSDVCPALDNFAYLGCFAGDLTTTIKFAPQNYVPGSPLSSDYPGFDPGSNINNTVTPTTCAAACRGFGFRVTALFNGGCRCGNQIPALTGGAGTCTFACHGDSSQICGGLASTAIFTDPTFADPAVLSTKTAAQIAANYKYMGCFYQSDIFPTNDANAHSTVATPQFCLAKCAALGYPLAKAAFAGAGSVTCDCGTTFAFNAYRVDESVTPTCSSSCTSNANSCDLTTGICCGQANTYPVYVNPELTGCYTPQIPGYGEPNALHTPTGFICATVPSSLYGGPKTYATTSYPARPTLASVALPTHPVSVTGNLLGKTFYQYACIQKSQPNAILQVGFVDVSASLQGGLGFSLENCADGCALFNYFGMSGGKLVFPRSLVPLEVGRMSMLIHENCLVRVIAATR